MRTGIAATVATFVLALPAMAEGDAVAGEKVFRQCKACHMVESPEETIVKGGRIGPNLYGVAGSAAGAQDGFRYSKLFEAANEQGVTWTEDNFVGYVQDPNGWLKDTTGASGRSKMSFKLRKEDDARDVYAYLKSLAE